MSVRPKTKYASNSAKDINGNRNAKLKVQLSTVTYISQHALHDTHNKPMKRQWNYYQSYSKYLITNYTPPHISIFCHICQYYCLTCELN
jgi:hypothetical protein